MGAVPTEAKMMTNTNLEHAEAEVEAQVHVWKYVLGFTETAVVKCAIELGVADVIDRQGSPMTLPELSAATRCAPAALYRIMRFLVHHKVFKVSRIIGPDLEEVQAYALTPVSRLLVSHAPDTMAAMILFETTPAMLAPWHALSGRVREGSARPFQAANGGEDIWSLASANPEHNKMLNDAMACDARVAVSKVLEGCPEVFEGVEVVVDVGGGDGTLMGMVVGACPWIRGVNFDLPHVVAVAPAREGVRHVGGDMFREIPKADAACFMKVLHDWGDDECIKILRKCREAIPEETGKIIIIEAVVNEEEESKLMNLSLLIDMVMIAHTNSGKERTLKEWQFVLEAAGFRRVSVKPNFRAVHYNVIEAFP